MYQLHPAILSSGIRSGRIVRALGPAAWFRYGIGTTVTGAGVSQWDDQSGNGRHLKQGTDTNRPALQADGSILFDGTDNFLKCDAFTLNQPCSFYLLLKQVTWTSLDRICDGNGLNTGAILQNGVSPDLAFNASSSVVLTGPALGTYAVLTTVFNGASSVGRVNLGTEVTGNPGAGNPGGFTLGARGSTDAQFANVEVREVLLFAAAHTQGQREAVIRYLASVGGVAV